jgi:tRNA acetyltransferase TAN1
MRNSSLVWNVLTEFNLLATTSRGNEAYARSELSHLLEQIGEPTPVVERTGISGLIVIRTSLNPFDVVKRFRGILRERPYEFRYTLRVIPIEKIVRTELSEIQNAVAELSSEIRPRETFRVTVEKRFTGKSTKDIIEAAAAEIKNKVNLTKPDRILLIEVVGRITGVSVIKPEDILSVLKEKIL